MEVKEKQRIVIQMHFSSLIENPKLFREKIISLIVIFIDLIP